MKDPLRKFDCHNTRNGDKAVIEAHYTTLHQHPLLDSNETKFWVRRGWFRTDACVGVLVGDYWQVTSEEIETDKDFAKHLGVKL